MIMDLRTYQPIIKPLTFGDHHQFTNRDIEKINETFAAMSSPKLIITTEKDATRIQCLEGLSEEVKKSIYSLPIKVRFMLNEEEFNEK